MQRKLVVPAALAAAALTMLGFAGCGRSGVGLPASTDDDAGNVAPLDSGPATSADVGTTSGDDAPSDAPLTTGPPLPDGGIYPHGNLLVASATLTLDGVTSDDFVIYTDLSTSTVFALSLAAGSKPITLGPVDSNNDVVVSRKAVLIATAVDTNGLGSVSVWTSPAATATPVPTTMYVGYYQVSPDSSHVLFLDDFTSTGADISIAATDGTGKTALASNINLSVSFCNPALGWAGPNAAAAYCLDHGINSGEPDGGTDPYWADVSLFAPGSTHPSYVGSGLLDTFATDEAGDVMVTVGHPGPFGYSVSGTTVSTAFPIDTLGVRGSVTGSPGVLTKDGSHLFYTTSLRGLNRAATSAPSGAMILVPGPSFTDVYALSPDEQWVVGTLNQNPGNGTTDLFLASATTPGAATALSETPSANAFGDLFTVDSSHVLFLATYSGASGGTLNAVAVAAPGTPTVLGTKAVAALGTSAAKIVFNANYDTTTKGADLFAVDTSQTAAPTLLVSEAGVRFRLNGERTVLVYTWGYQGGANAGLWTMGVP